MSTVRAGGDNNVPAPEENEVVIDRSFFKAGLRFPLRPSLDTLGLKCFQGIGEGVNPQ
jgi:hypothetical protein